MPVISGICLSSIVKCILITENKDLFNVRRKSLPCFGWSRMRIHNLTVIDDGTNTKLSILVESKQLGRKELWFSIPEKYHDCLCKTRVDGFLVGMLFPAMCYGEDIHLEECVSEKLLFNLNHYVVPLLKTFSPFCKTIKITAGKTISERFECHGVGTGFSGGVDSFCTLYDRYELETDSGYKINKLLFLNVGSHGPGQTEEELTNTQTKFNRRYEYLKTFPDELGLDFIPLDSNLHLFHPWGHQLTCSLTLAAGALMLQNIFRRYYCASLGWSYQELLKYHKFDLNKDIAVFDPILLPLLSTESLELIPEGTHYTRIEKLLRIINYEPVRRYLNVCVHDHESHKNCSVCTKCCRTLMTLNSIGKLNDFVHLFDVDKYKTKAERQFVIQQILLAPKDPFARGNVELAKENGIKLPSRFASYAYWCANKVKKHRKALKRRLFLHKK